MKIGMCMFLWTTHVLPEHEPLLRNIKAVGFDGVEIPIFEGGIDHYTRLGALLDRIGLERTAVSAMDDPALSLIGDTESRLAGVAYMRHTLDCTAALGARMLSGPLHSTLGHFSGFGPSAKEITRSIGSQQRIGDHAARRGVTVALEALNRFECYLVNTMDDLCGHVAAIGHPNIRAMYDTFHSNIEESDPVAAFVRHADEIAHVHLSESDRGVPGRGHVPWPATFRAMRAAGYDGWLTIEAFGRSLPALAAATKVWRDFSEGPEAVYRDGFAHIRAGWDAAA